MPENAQPDWRESLPAEIKGAPALKDVKDVGMLAKNYLEAQSALGGAVRIPSKEAGDEGRKAFRGRILEIGKDHGVTVIPSGEEDDTPFFRSIGYPEAADKYSLPDGVKPEGDVAKLLGAAHGAKLTDKQFKRLYEAFDKEAKGQNQVLTSKKEEGVTMLKKEWGEAYDTRIGEVGAMLKSDNAPAQLQEAYANGRVDAQSIKWLHSVMSALGEGTDLSTQGKQGSGGKLTPVEALARVEELETRINKMDPGDPDYQVLLARRIELLEQSHSA